MFFQNTPEVIEMQGAGVQTLSGTTVLPKKFENQEIKMLFTKPISLKGQ